MAMSNLVAIWYIFSRFGMLNEGKSGNPERDGLFIACAQRERINHSSLFHDSVDSAGL
jgi:hypothetical protein